MTSRHSLRKPFPNPQIHNSPSAHEKVLPIHDHRRGHQSLHCLHRDPPEQVMVHEEDRTLRTEKRLFDAPGRGKHLGLRRKRGNERIVDPHLGPEVCKLLDDLDRGRLRGVVDVPLVFRINSFQTTKFAHLLKKHLPIQIKH